MTLIRNVMTIAAPQAIENSSGYDSHSPATGSGFGGRKNINAFKMKIQTQFRQSDTDISQVKTFETTARTMVKIDNRK